MGQEPGSLISTSRGGTPTIIFHARSVPAGWQRVAADTVTSRVPWIERRVPAWLRRNRRVAFAFDREYDKLSYVVDWLDAFRASPRLRPELADVNDALAYGAALRKLRRTDLAIILHSAAGDNLSRLTSAISAFQARSGKLVVFFGNEYSLMREKIAFARAVEADFIATQLPLASAEWLYADATSSVVVQAPPGLNANLYRPLARPRKVDVGFRGDLYGKMFALGDIERAGILHFFQKNAEALGLSQDIRFERYPRDEWCEFLNQCRGTIGAEAGTYYLERDDRTRDAATAYLALNPAATFEDVFERFFRTYESPVSGKAVSSRHFEAAGTKTCQILLEGAYNGILVGDEHFICVRKDYGNVEDVVLRFKDEDYRTAMVDRAYEHVIGRHTYRHRVDTILDTILG